MEYSLVSNNTIFTMSLGEKMANVLPNGSVICLTGDLGAGKTTLIRGIAKALHIKDVVQSPTFNIMKVYMKGDKPLIHIDAYRLADVNVEIGLDEYIGYETGLTVIEWPEYIKNLIPKNAINMELKHLGGDKRSITFSDIDKDFLEAIK